MIEYIECPIFCAVLNIFQKNYNPSAVLYYCDLRLFHPLGSDPYNMLIFIRPRTHRNLSENLQRSPIKQHDRSLSHRKVCTPAQKNVYSNTPKMINFYNINRLVFGMPVAI